MDYYNCSTELWKEFETILFPNEGTKRVQGSTWMRQTKQVLSDLSADIYIGLNRLKEYVAVMDSREA